MRFFLKEFVVCSCNGLFDFFKVHNFARQQDVGLLIRLTLLFQCFDILHNKNK